MSLFTTTQRSRSFALPAEVHHAALRARTSENHQVQYSPSIGYRTLEIFEHADNPEDPLELRDLWIGRVEAELGEHCLRKGLADRWLATKRRREVGIHEVLNARATVRFVKELFNWYFRDDLYGDLRCDSHLILSSGSVDEEAWGLPEPLKDCVRYALERDWYGYSDSRGRIPSREAVADYENARIAGRPYNLDNVALTMGGTFAISTLADFILSGSRPGSSPVLCGIPNYPPLVEAIARRCPTRLVPLTAQSGHVSVDSIIEELTPDTPMVMLQTAANPTGALIAEPDLERLIGSASPSTMILLDECHEWLGPQQIFSPMRARPNVIRVSSISKAWSAPGLKIGWILADAAFIAEYYEYASTTFGGPPSFFYTLVEVLARMERWIVEGIEEAGESQLNEFEGGYALEGPRLRDAYRRYRTEREARHSALTLLRDAATTGLAEAQATVIPARYSINLAAEFPGWDDSYKCFRDLLRETGVSVYPGILTFCPDGASVRITTAREWSNLSAAIARIQSRLEPAIR